MLQLEAHCLPASLPGPDKTSLDPCLRPKCTAQFRPAPPRSRSPTRVAALVVVVGRLAALRGRPRALAVRRVRLPRAQRGELLPAGQLQLALALLRQPGAAPSGGRRGGDGARRQLGRLISGGAGGAGHCAIAPAATPPACHGPGARLGSRPCSNPLAGWQQSRRGPPATQRAALLSAARPLRPGAAALPLSRGRLTWALG